MFFITIKIQLANIGIKKIKIYKFLLENKKFTVFIVIALLIQFQSDLSDTIISLLTLSDYSLVGIPK